MTAVRDLRDVSRPLAAPDAHLEAITARTPALLRAGALLAEIIDVQSAA
ncbi:hypothetical protein [Streptomyces sp. CMB-StM0423]|nr:hypothetical protein [Streptomyces sp. CMB-StM0423]